MAMDNETPFHRVPMTPTSDALPAFETDCMDDSHSDFYELWSITRRAYEIRDNLLASRSGARGRKKIYIQTGGVVMLGLRTMFIYAQRQVQHQDFDAPLTKTLSWWNRAFLHIDERYTWYTSNESTRVVSSRYRGEVKCMDMALNTCVERTRIITQREDACGYLVGLVPMKELEDSRGWWRLMELSCIHEPHDEYITLDACRTEVADFDDRIAAAKNSTE